MTPAVPTPGRSAVAGASRCGGRPWRWATALAALLLAVPLAAAAEIVKDLRVQRRGGGALEEASVRAFISSKAGEELSRAGVGRDVKNLQKSGRFSYVESRVEPVTGGVSLTFVVELKARIRRLDIAGADYLGNKKVRELLELGSGDLVDEATLATRAVKVVETYRKKYFPDPRLSWTFAPVEGQDLTDVRVDLREGHRATVQQINFIGNRQLSSRTLRRVMKQRRTNLISWITSDGTYNPDDLAADREALRRAYLDQGYLDADVGEAEVRPLGRRGLAVDIRVAEGARYTISGFEVAGTKAFPQAEVESACPLRVGATAAMADIDQAPQALRDYYGARGHIRTAADAELDTDPVRHTTRVRFLVREGQLAHIRNIRIRGNTRTKDKVIRRELTVFPGDVFNEVKVRTSQHRLQNLQYFKFVDVAPQATAEDNQYDLNIDVEEDRTGKFMVGAGFSSIDNLVGFVELSQGNFDLFGWPHFTGGGQKLNIRFQGGSLRRDMELAFIEPYFLDRRLSLGVSLFQHDSSVYSTEFSQKNTGGRLTLGQPLPRGLFFDRLNYIYSLQAINVYDITTNSSPQLQAEAGRRLKSAFDLELVHDSRDNVFVPTRGNRTVLFAELAGGPLGGETDLYALQARSAQYFPLWFEHVLSFKGQMAVVDRYDGSTRVPIFDRLFLGGPQNIRAFRYREVGPTDGSANNEPIGGRSLAYGTVEYTVPVVEKVRLAAFYDVGMVWEDVFYFNLHHLNSGFGVGIRLDFPGFPIQLDYAWPLKADDFNDRPSGRFNFWIGYTY
ncbi:MAG: outer membrane protein assembly factor BamA [Kiritimatiellaeota bacterium]|nr:outer membrane protein assembly factor BamA [Kiritimatiellota bacterium]